jgi:hypothetical protein
MRSWQMVDVLVHQRSLRVGMARHTHLQHSLLDCGLQPALAATASWFVCEKGTRAARSREKTRAVARCSRDGIIVESGLELRASFLEE